MRRFDSLRMALRAFELVRVWRAQREVRRTKDASLVCMPEERVTRTELAALYLHRRVLRAAK